MKRPTALWAAFLLVATSLAFVAGLAPFSPALPAWAHGGEVVLACDVNGTVGDRSDLRGIRFTAGASFDSVELRMDGNVGGTYTFTAELRRSTGYTDPVEASVPVSALLPGGAGSGGLGSVVHLDFPRISVSGPETFTLRFVGISGPGTLFHEVSGLNSDPCPNVEQTEENNLASPTVRPSDPTGFFVLRHNVLVVNDVGDHPDANPGDGVCATAGGVCTLRAALMEANALAGEDVINFNVTAVDGPATITVSGSSLPAISDQVTIDGTTQPSYAGTPLIELTWGGGDATPGVGLQVSTHSTLIKGLAITGFGTGVQFDGSGPQQNQIRDSFIGTADGITAKPNTIGIRVFSCCNLVGPNNVISGNTSDGVLITGSAASGNQVLTNSIGTTAAGLAPLGNNAGISLQNGTTGNLINANTIAGNQVGIVVQAPGNRIMDNDIGLDGVGNVTHGVQINSDNTTVGVQADGRGLPNRIVGNGSNGVMVLTGTGNRISNNVIRDNGGLGIELSNEGVTPNDIGDGDTGPNNLQNFPVLAHDGAETLTASVDGAAAEGTLYRFELFEVSSCDPSGHGEGDLQKGSGAAAADVNGDATASFAVTEAGIYTATVTDVDGNTSEFSGCLNVAVPAVVETLEVTVDQATSGPGATSVNLIDIPIEAVFGAQGSSTSASPLGAVPLGAVDLGASPLGAVPLGAVPLGAVPLGAVPLGAVPLGAVTVDYPGGWSALLEGTPFDGAPLQTILLSEVIAYADTNPGSALAAVTISQVSLDATPLGAVSLMSLSLGALPLGAVSADTCSEATSEGFTCDATTTTLLELELSGFDVAASPLGAVPLGAVPLGSVPLGAVPLGAVPLGAVPLGAVPLGSVPLGAVPLGAVPLGSVPLGSVPLGSVPLGAVPLGAVDLGGTPLGAVTLSLVDGCLALDCVALGLTGDSTLHDAAVAWESSNSTTLAASPLGAVPLGAVPLGSVPLGAVPLGAVPLGAVDLAGTPLGAVPLGAVGGCDLLTGFAHTCASLGADGDTSLYELAVLLEAEGSSLAASPLGAVTVDQLPLGAIDPLALLGIDATLADVFAGTTLADVTDWGSITLGQIIIAMLIVADYPWEELELDELGVQDFAATGAVVTYTAQLGVTGGPGLVEVTATLPDGYRYRTGTARLNTAMVLDPVVDQVGNIQTLRFFVTVGPGVNALSFDVAPGLRLGTSSIDVAAGAVSTLDAAPHTVVEATPFAVLSPDVLYFGYITTTADVDTYQIVPPGEGFRTSVFLGHLSEDVDLVMYRPTTAPTSVSGTPLGAVPFEDEGSEAASQPLSPEALADIPITAPDSLAAVSANRSTTAESTSVVEDGTQSGNYTIQVSGYNGVTSDDAYILRAKIRSEVPSPSCTGRGSIATGLSDLSALTAPGLESVFVVNGARLDALHGAGSSTAVLDSLATLVAYLNDPANGFGSAAIIRVDGVDYSAWDANPCDPHAANQIAEAIRGPIVSYAEANPSLKYVTIIGSDEVIPFFRQPDDTAYANESTYAGEFEDNALYGSLFTRHILTDDGYGDLDPIPWLDHALFLPELGVGRLVEEPADIVGQVSTFVAFNGTLDSSTGFVSGYDFLTDGAGEVASNLSAGGATTTTLISETWTAGNLIDGVLAPDAVPDAVSPNAHYDHHRALPAAEQGTPEGGLTSDVLFDVGDVENFGLANPGDLARALIFTMGCHAGTNVADISVLSTSSTNPTDWAQVYGQEAATYVANTGYGYGDTVTVALSEKLMAEFALRLDGSLSAGQALVGAKQHYFGNLGLYGVYDEKALQEIVFYGLPMYRVGASTAGPAVPPEPIVVADPGTGLAVASFNLSLTFSQETSALGTFFTIDGDTQGIHYRPIQPKVSTDVTVAGKVAKGALITGLVTTDVPVTDPAFFRPLIDLSGNEPEIENFDQIFPTTFANIATFQRPSAAAGSRSETRQSLNLVAGQYVGATKTQRLFDDVDIEVLYLDEGAAGVADFTPPTFRSVQAAIVGGTAGFVVDLANNADAVRVLVLYRDASGLWKSAELVSGSPWTGGGAVAAGTTVIEYFVQAVDASGNVGMSSFKGDFHEGVVVPTAVGGTDPTVSVTGDLVDGWFTTGATVAVSGGGDYTATVDGIAQDLTNGSFTIATDGVHIVEIFGGEPDPVTLAVKVDTTSPQVVIRSPADADTYLLGQAVPADYRCADAGSGVRSCVGTVPDGEPFDTTAVGSKSFSVTASDFAGHSASASATYQVVRDLDLMVAPALLAVGDTATATSPLDGNFVSAVIDWGDGATCIVGATECTVTGSPEGTLTATHAYGAPDVYTVTLTVVYEGLTLTDTFEFVVVYDPSAGFVTGGGEFDSHAGAYRLDPSAEGLAKFGFVSRYKKGTSVPSGNTAFEFSAGDLKFKSTSYEWLVISGHTSRFKGVGTINGAGEFGFILSAFDSDINRSDSFTDDLFRIKIWDVLTGETVYDTGCDSDGVCAEDLPSDVKKGAVPIRGSIVIHE